MGGEMPNPRKLKPEADRRGTVDEDPPKGVRYDEKHDNLQRAGPGGLRRLNKVLRHDILHGGFGHPGDGRNQNDGDWNDDAGQARAQNRGQCDGQQNGGERIENIQGAHDDLGIGLAEIAGNDPQDTAHDGGQRHRQEAHQQAQAPAVQAAGQDVAPLLVCSQQMAGRADALQPLRRIALKGGILGEQRRAEGAQHHDHEQDQRGKGRRVTEKGPHKAAARLPAEMELLRIRRSSGANG